MTNPTHKYLRSQGWIRKSELDAEHATVRDRVAERLNYLRGRMRRVRMGAAGPSGGLSAWYRGRAEEIEREILFLEELSELWITDSK